MEMAVALQKAGLQFVVLEKGVIGQTMSWWAPATRWFSSNERISIAGVPLVTPDQSKASREQYLAYLLGVARQFDLPIHTYETVTDVRRRSADALLQASLEGSLRVCSQRQGIAREYHCRAVILATGGTDFPNKLNVPGEDLPHVESYLREPHFYFGRQVVILGGRNSAVEAALRLAHVGADVTLCYRGLKLPEEQIKYWLLPEIQTLLKTGRIRGIFGAKVDRITTDRVFLSPMTATAANTIPTAVAAEHVLCMIGYRQDTTLYQRIGIRLTEPQQAPEVDPLTMQSSVPGVYIAGTAVAGTQSSRYRVFLENCHDHIPKILQHLTGKPRSTPSSEVSAAARLQPES